MKKRLAFCLCTVLLLALLTGCGGKSKLSEMQKRGKMIVGTSADYAPYEYLQDGEYLGFDMDLVREMAARLDLELELVNYEYEELLTSVQSGKVDIAIACMNSDAESLELVDFTDVYYRDVFSVLCPAGAAVSLADEGNFADYTIGVQSGSNHEAWLISSYVMTGLMDDSQIFRYSTVGDGISELSGGRIDLFFTDAPVARSFAASTNLDIVYEFEAVPDGGARIAAPKDQDDLIAALNSLIAEMAADGTLEALEDNWLV